MTTTPRIACEPVATVAQTAHGQAEFKTSLRRTMRTVRAELGPSVRAAHDAAVAVNLRKWLGLHPVQTLGVYWPIHGEPDLHDFYENFASVNMCLALPDVMGPQLPLQFLAWAPGDALIVGNQGIATPTKRVPILPQALLIPCVAFNSDNFRLGYGGGFYDRTLLQSPQITAIGVAYSCTRTSFTAAAHDIAMDVMITENLLLAAKPQLD